MVPEGAKTTSVLLLRFFLRVYNLYFSPDKNLAARIRDMTGFVPARLAIFKLAFSHKSNQNRGDLPVQTNNERLEYLGDAVLGTIVAEYLFKKYPNGNEGFLTKMRSKIVKRNSLNRIGDEMGLDVLLTEYNRTRLSSSMLGNAVEALVGAVYLEKGYRETKRFVIRRMLRNYVDMDHLETVDDNYKSQLLEYCQKNGRSIGYQIVNKYKHERRDRFKIGVVIAGETVATADDFNKKAAEQLASRKALVKMGVLEADAESGAALPVKRTPKRRALIVDDAPEAPTASKPPRKPKRSHKPARDPSQEAPAPELTQAPAVAKTAHAAVDPPTAEAPKPKGRRPRKPSLNREIRHSIAVVVAGISAADEQVPRTPVIKIAPSAEQVEPGALVIEPNEIQRLGKPELPESLARAPTAAVGEGAVKRPDKRRRKRRPLPLYILNPAIEDVSATAALTAGWIDPPEVAPEDSDWEDVEFELQPEPVAEPTSWEDTPLEHALTEVPDEAPADAHRPRRRRPKRGTSKEATTESE